MEPQRRLLPEEWAVAALLLGMTAIVIINVASRFVFNASLAYTEDLAVDVFVWVVFLAAGLSVVRRAHVGFAVLTDRLPVTWQRYLDRFGRVLFLAFFAIMTVYGVSVVLSEYHFNQTTPAMGWPAWWFALGVPLGTCLACVRIVRAFGRDRGGDTP